MRNCGSWRNAPSGSVGRSGADMSDEIGKVSTPRGEARAVREIPPHEINPSFGGQSTGSDWFGPSTPLAPIAPPEVAGRQWDYPTAFNLNQQPRGYEPVSFATLRALADNCDLLRLVIERRKDQLCGQSWSIRPRTDANKKPRRADLSAATRSRIDEITRLFRRPSYNETFRSFLRQLLESLRSRRAYDLPEAGSGRMPYRTF